MEINMERRQRQGLVAVNLGLVANVFLAVLKTGVGVVGQSPALLADGIHAMSDVAFYIVVSVFMRLAHKPPDPEHPLGHNQMESIAALVVGSFVVTTAVAVFWNAISATYDLLTGASSFTGASSIALWVALGTVVLKIGLTVYTQGLGKQTKNVAVLALAYDHRNDIFSGLGAAVGIFMGRMGYPWADPLAGAVVAVVILHAGITMLRASSADLMDTIPGQALEGQIRQLLSTVPGVEQVTDIYAHRFGPYLVVHLTIVVDGSLNVAAGHRIATRVEQTLYQHIEFLRLAHIHCQPAEG
jgi:cation diffusion facilitator family transporter